MTTERQAISRKIMSHHSKSFSWGARLLPARFRQDATALYAWCRRCDDAVDLPSDPEIALAAVAGLRDELGRVYGPNDQPDPILGGFQDVVRRHDLPRRYADDLLDGMAMDVGFVRYRSYDDLLLYCYRVAGTVGLMMAHIMKVRDPDALRRATDMGIAMQLTNISRDVAEDERRDRVYLPEDLLDLGATGTEPDVRAGRAVAELLRRAEGFYASGDQGLAAMPVRCAVAIRAARLIYSDIGTQIARRGFDVRAGRAFVSRPRKLWLALRAVVGTVPSILWRRFVGRLGGTATAAQSTEVP